MALGNLKKHVYWEFVYNYVRLIIHVLNVFFKQDGKRKDFKEGTGFTLKKS